MKPTAAAVVVNGQLILLRASLGLTKVRSTATATTLWTLPWWPPARMAWSRRWQTMRAAKSWEFLQEGFPDPATGETQPAAFDRARQHLPEPWTHFSPRVAKRACSPTTAALREDMQRLGTYADDDLKRLRTLFVSRAHNGAMAAQFIRRPFTPKPERLLAQ